MSSNSWPQQPDDDLRIDTAWRENYSGASINQKLHGIVNTGVYSGFKVIPAPGLSVEVSGLGDPNIAIIEIDTYSLTARMPETSKKKLGVVAGKKQYVVLEVVYAKHQQSNIKLLVKDTVSSNNLVVAMLDIPAEATAVKLDMIEQSAAAKSVTQSEYASLAALVIDNSRRQIDIAQRLSNLEKLNNV